jgi:dCTP diphosphatase
MSDATTTINDLKTRIKKIVEDRDWQQFHTPKNMSMHIAIEAAELMEIFAWADQQQSFELCETKRDAIEQELADIAFGVFNFCSRMNIDLATAFERKMILNEKKYPIEKCKGTSKKYNEL